MHFLVGKKIPPLKSKHTLKFVFLKYGCIVLSSFSQKHKLDQACLQLAQHPKPQRILFHFDVFMRRFCSFTNCISINVYLQTVKKGSILVSLKLYINTGTICGGIETSYGAVKIRKDPSQFGGAVSVQHKTNQVIVSKKSEFKSVH